MKILVAVDGSPISTRAAKHAIGLAQKLESPPEIVLFHSDPPVMQAVAVRIGIEAVQRYHAESAKHALKPARAALNRAHVPFVERSVVGDPSEAIVREADKGRFDLIVMGTHGHGAIKGLFVGSVASKVLAQTTRPVTLVH